MFSFPPHNFNSARLQSVQKDLLNMLHLEILKSMYGYVLKIYR